MHLDKKIVIFLAVIIILVIGGGILAWQYLTPKEEVKAPEDETADWKVYVNDQFSYQFKYPSDYEDLTETKRAVLAEGNEHISIARFTNYIQGIDIIEGIAIAFSDVDNNKQLLPLDFAKDYLSQCRLCDPDSLIEQISIGGRRAAKISGPVKGTSKPANSNITIFVSTHSTTKLLMVKSLFYPVANYPEELDQVLSTFRFLE